MNESLFSTLAFGLGVALTALGLLIPGLALLAGIDSLRPNSSRPQRSPQSAGSNFYPLLWP